MADYAACKRKPNNAAVLEYLNRHPNEWCVTSKISAETGLSSQVVGNALHNLFASKIIDRKREKIPYRSVPMNYWRVK